MVPSLLLLHYGGVKREERISRRSSARAIAAIRPSVPRYDWKF